MLKDKFIRKPFFALFILLALIIGCATNKEGVYESYQKSGKIDADQVDLGLRNTAGEEFIPDYPYTITINDEDCVNQVVEKEEAVSQATSAAVSLTEAEEMVKIVASGSPAFCRSDSAKDLFLKN